ncbi:MAG: endonuclease/exonuclease/phosphatase family protein [Planctomycetota bacterium]|nr:endonuclease/exonuclease/phosphatase family protein [Planctomycetota bacterium]
MGNTTLAALVALCMAACAGPSATGVTGGQPHELVLLTYNIHHGEGDDGVFDLERQARVILDSGADLVVLQEVDVGTGRAGGVDQATELGRLTGMHATFAEAMPYDGGSYGEALLSRWPLVAAETWPLPATAGREPRAAVVAVVEPPGLGWAVRVIGTHLDHLEDEELRVAQVEALLGYLAPSRPHSGLPTVLMGDMNARPGSGPIELLQEAGWTAADPDLGPTYPAIDPVRKIDWILLGPRSPGSLSGAEVLFAPVASDHAPLRATWCLP